MEKKIVSLQVNDNIDETTKSVVSLKTQLRQAQQEVAELSEKFGATSKEAVEAAKKAAILKDTIGDAKTLTDAFNPDAKFKALSSSLSGVASGFAAYQGALGLVGVESKDLEKQLLKVQSAMAIAEGLQGLGEAKDSFKQLKAVGVNAFNAIKTAIGSTGIGLIVVAAGAIYAYWDDIKGAVSGVSEEQKKLNGLTQKNADLAAAKLKDLGNQDNVLKLQGKSEQEILNIKIKATNEAISAAKINIKNQEITNKLAVEGAKRNFEYLKSAIDFISLPQRYLFETGAKAINKIIDLINKIPGVEIKGKLDEKFGDKASEFITKLAFDPSKTKLDGEATIAAAKESIDKMINDRAGMQLSINSINKQASTDAKAKMDADSKEQLELEKKAYEERNKLASEQGEKAREELENTEKLAKEIKQKNIDAEKTENQLKVEAENAEYERKKSLLIAANLSTEELDKLHKENLNKLELEYFAKESDNAVAATAKTKELSEARKKITEEEYKAKITQAQEASAVLGQLSDLAGKETIAGKALGIASATVNTYVGVTEALKQKSTLPSPFDVVAKVANVATVLATGFKAVKAITSVKIPGGGGGGSAPTPMSVSSGSAATAAPAAAAPSFNVVGTSGQNQIAQSLGNQAPVKAYVVSNDVTTAQSLDRNIVSTATLGN